MTSETKSHDDKPAPAGRRSRYGRAAVAAGLAAGVALLCAAAVPASAATAATPAAAATPPASSVSGHLTGSASQASAAARRTEAYWTRARMLSAANGAGVSVKSASDSRRAPAIVSGPAGRVGGAAPDQALKGPVVRVPATGDGVRPAYGSIGSPWPGRANLPPATTTGRVFFTTRNGEDWSCSGSTVNSAGKDSVITAGHCVYGSIGGQVPGEGWHANWIFVPGYDNGYAPYGVWTARELWTPTSYYDNQDEGDDMGGAVINTNAYGQHIVNVVGGQGIAWNYPNDQFVYDLGYPAEAPFNGATLDYCTDSEFNWSGVADTMGLSCNFTGGSSGGPWLMSFNGELGYVNGVNDFGYSALPGYIFAAYFGNNAASLYNAMAGL